MTYDTFGLPPWVEPTVYEDEVDGICGFQTKKQEPYGLMCQLSKVRRFTLRDRLHEAAAWFLCTAGHEMETATW